MLQAWSYGNSLGGWPSTVIVMRLFSILLERRFRRSVLMRERAEKPHSQSAVDIGISRPMAANLLILGNIHFSSSVFRICFIN